MKLKLNSSTCLVKLIGKVNECYSDADDVQIIQHVGDVPMYYAIIKYKGKTNK